MLAPTDHALELAADRSAADTLSSSSPQRGADAAAQRAPAPPQGALRAPRSVDAALARPGQPLDAATRTAFEPRLGADFSRVRVHHDEPAARSARAIGAQAYSSGEHIVFGRGRWQPGTPRGSQLLAHELAHVAQQQHRAAGSPTPLVWRKGLDITDFDAGSFTDATLLAYLQKLRDSKKIEDNRDSDDKARGVVKRWMNGGDDYALEPELKVLLVKEMQSGFTGNDDERAILNLLENSARPDVEAMFGPGALDPDDLDSDFHGDEEDALRAFYDRLFVGGRKAAMKGGAAFTAEPESALKAPYSHAALRVVIDERMSRIDRVVRDRPPDRREWIAQKLARASVPTLQAQLKALPPDQHDAAAHDLAGDRVQKDSQAKALDNDIAKAPTPLQAQLLGRKQVVLRAEVLLLDLAMHAAFRDITLAAPPKAADFQKLTQPLDAATKKAAQEAITPMTAEEVIAEATGAPAPPPPVFKPVLPDGSKYEDKVKTRIPKMIDERHASIAASRTKKEHDDPTLARSMDAMQLIANKAKDEVDLVFGNLYDKAKFSAFQADKRSKSGALVKKGNLRDAWQVEEDRRKADPNHKKQSAKFWLFYLIQNDGAIQTINLEHDASPSFGDDSKARNDEAKLIRKVGDPFLVSDRTRLFEIGRGWDAFAEGKDVLVQLFKNPDPKQDRVFLWDMYTTVIHEYLHKLAHKTYDKYAKKLGGEHSTEGSTLIEGVDSLLSEIMWTSAVGRAALPEVRKVVEPDAVAAGLPFDPDLLPERPPRAGTYDGAVRLVSVVGIRNLYAAYFQGKVELIGGS